MAIAGRMQTILRSTDRAFLLSACVLRGGLDALYVGYVNPAYRYAGFELEWQPLVYLESWALFFLSLLIVPENARKPSDFYMFLTAFTIIMPMSSLYGLAGVSRWPLYGVLVGYILILIVKKGKRFSVPKLKDGPQMALSISWTMVLLIMSWQVVSGGLNYFNFDLTRVYEFRSDASEAIDRGLFAYLNSWGSKVFNVFLLAYGLYKRSFPLIAATLVVQAFFFGISAQKAVVFYPALVIGVWYYFRRGTSFSPVLAGLIAVVFVSGFFWIVLGMDFMVSLLVRRLFFSLALNIYDYFDYFGSNEFVYWSNSIARSFIEYPYPENPADWIGIVRGTDDHVNTSFLANGYMHAGLIGLLVYCFLAGLLLRLIDSLAASGLPMWFVVAVTIVPMFQLITASDLPTALLTKGLGVSLFLVFLVRIPVRRRDLVQA